MHIQLELKIELQKILKTFCTLYNVSFFCFIAHGLFCIGTNKSLLMLLITLLQIIKENYKLNQNSRHKYLKRNAFPHQS